MAIFRDADPLRHGRQAVRCALGILRRTRELNEVLHRLPEPIGVHVGVNSGVATVGATKIEGVNGTRWTYTASGQVTIVAARLAALSRTDEILVGAAPGTGWAQFLLRLSSGPPQRRALVFRGAFRPAPPSPPDAAPPTSRATPSHVIGRRISPSHYRWHRSGHGVATRRSIRIGRTGG
jgi:hypothetical protein